MVFHMKTTLIIPDPVYRGLKRYAAKRGTSMSEVATKLLFRGLPETRKPKRPFRFPTFETGPPKVDVADRERLYGALETERDARLYGTRKER